MPHGNEIGLLATVARSRKTSLASTPIVRASSVAKDPAMPERVQTTSCANSNSTPSGLANVEKAARPTRRGRTIDVTSTIRQPSSPQPIADGTKNVTSEPRAASSQSAIPDVPTLVMYLIENQTYRKFAIKGQQWCDRRTESLIASRIGYDPENKDEKERRALFAKAASIRTMIEKEENERKKTGKIRIDHPDISREGMLKVIINSAASRQTWDTMRGKCEANIADFAKMLPVYEWAKGVRGFGDRGLGIIVAEAAGIEKHEDGTRKPPTILGEYRSIAGLWKRMGLATIDGERQRKMSDKDAASAHGYNPKRRAECWTLAESLLKAQICSALRASKEAIQGHPDALEACEKAGIVVAEVKKVEVLTPILEEFGLSGEQYALGPYGEEYLKRRAYTAERISATEVLPLSNVSKWTKARCHNDAARIMFKALLRDLWIEWRRVDREAAANQEIGSQ